MPLWGDALINQQPGLLLIVQKLPGANTLEVTKGVEEAMDEMRPGLPGIQIDTKPSSGRPPSSTWHSTTSWRRCSSGSCS